MENRRFATAKEFAAHCEVIVKARLDNKITPNEAYIAFEQACEDFWYGEFPEDANPEDDFDDCLEMGFDPYEGAYTYDC